jgi:hypothetical protein
MTKRRFTVLLILLACGLFLVGSVLASNGVAIERSVIGGGGEEVTDGSLYILVGTLGEPVASAIVRDTDYGLGSGFWWFGGESRIYLPLLLRNYS